MANLNAYINLNTINYVAYIGPMVPTTSYYFNDGTGIPLVDNSIAPQYMFAKITTLTQQISSDLYQQLLTLVLADQLV